MRFAFFAVLAFLLSFTQRGDAVNRLGFELGSLSGPGWRISALRGRIDPVGNGFSIHLQADTLRLPGRVGLLRQISLDCPVARIRPEYDCPAGRLRAFSPTWGPIRGTFAGRFSTAARQGHGRLALLLKHGDRLYLRLSKEREQWRAQGRAFVADLSAWRGALPASVAELPAHTPLTVRFAGRFAPGGGNAQLHGHLRARDAFNLALRWRGTRWHARGEGTTPDLAYWIRWIPAWPKDWKGAGTLHVAFAGEGPDWSRFTGGRMQATLRHASFSDASGLKAGDRLRAALQLSLRQVQNGVWAEDSRLQWQAGELLFNPWYGKVDGVPVQVHNRGIWQNDSARLIVKDGAVDWPGIGALRFTGMFRKGAWLAGPLELSGESLNLHGLYQALLKPWVADKTAFTHLDASGALDFSVALRNAEPQAVNLRLGNVTIDDGQSRLRVSGLNSRVQWRADGQRLPFDIAWNRLDVYRLPLGPARIQAETAGQRVRLRAPARIPLLGGDLDIKRFEGDHLGGNGRWRMSAALSPVSMTALTKRLGWPVFGGTLSAEVPDVQYAHGEARVGGTVRAAAFNGQIQVRDLRVKDLFGRTPMLTADVDMHRLNLEDVTRAFDFGRITGLMSGSIHQLRLENWQPAHFVAAFHNVPAPGVSQRINQRAVQNLTRLGGGGAAAVLQRGFLQFFKEFSYSALGMQVVLNGNRAVLDGIQPAKQGFYILRGSGLPRVDIIGYNKTVDWRDFVARVQTAIQKGGVTVQ